MEQGENYFVSHLDEALEKHWLKVYYQPVMRTLTGEVCGAEALVRWEDPAHGFLTPDKFVPVFESTGEIWRLDRAVLRLVCQELQTAFQAGRQAEPVSVNLAWQEFLRPDTFDYFEKTLEQYDVPRDFVRLEITERAIEQDDVRLRESISHFREAGYHVWLDDFGSEYSALNVLKDYDFDLIKLDLRFLSSFTDKAKKILTAVVNMAKNIGVCTLAEGVERPEHAVFLHQIGCEKMQGYYYGKPMPSEKLVEHIAARGFRCEERRLHHYYTCAGACVHPSSDSMALIEYSGGQFHSLYVNDRYVSEVRSLGYQTFDAALAAVNEPGSPLYPKFRTFLEATRRAGGQETFFYLSHDNYLRLTVRLVAEMENRCIFRVSILNLTYDAKVRDRMQLDKSLRNVYQMFDTIRVLDLKNDLVRVLFSNHTIAHEIRGEEHGLELVHHEYQMLNLHTADRQRYGRFTDPLTLARRLHDAPRQMLTDLFRFRNQQGGYEWKELTLIAIHGTECAQVLACLKGIVMPEQPVLGELQREGEWEASRDAVMDEARERNRVYALLWANLMESADTCFFWKDRDLRFRGASQSFMESYGLESLDKVIGKTDGEIGWHVDDAPMRRAELAVVEKGAILSQEPGECLIRGRLRPIRYSKRPIYDQGKIIGLLGYVEDEESIKRRRANLSDAFLIDPPTGLMNATGCVQVLFRCQEEKRLHGRHYGLILLAVTTFRRIVDTYGDEAGQELLVRIADNIFVVAGQDCAASRLAGATFALLRFYEREDELGELAAKLKQRLEQLHQVQGAELTVRVETQIVLDGEDGISPATIYQHAWENKTGVQPQK